MNDRWRAIRAWSVPVALAGLVVWASVFTGRRHPVVRAIMRPLPYADKVGHIGLYGSLTAALIVVLERRDHSRRTVLIAAATVFVLGLLDELRQIPAARRSFSVGDLTANAVGVLGGAVVGLVIAYVWRRRDH